MEIRLPEGHGKIAFSTCRSCTKNCNNPIFRLRKGSVSAAGDLRAECSVFVNEQGNTALTHTIAVAGQVPLG